ncbi:MAG: putative toxin, partial [Candidatus Nanopelagicales bacterium]|nr:putative toxin [Candidatus Nanopelagicales bacterium]
VASGTANLGVAEPDVPDDYGFNPCFAARGPCSWSNDYQANLEQSQAFVNVIAEVVGVNDVKRCANGEGIGYCALAATIVIPGLGKVAGKVIEGGVKVFRALRTARAADDAADAARVAAEAAEATARARGLGKAGEDAVREAYDIGPKRAIKVWGRKRIPDGINKAAVSEVKNVQNLSYTRQLRDYADYASQNGLRFDLYVRGGESPTTLSRPLEAAVQSGEISLRPIP